MSSHWRLVDGFWLLFILWDQTSSGFILKQILGIFGIDQDPNYSLPAATNLLFTAITQRMNIPLLAAQIPFAVFAVLWAPIGEELFYRGYIFGTLRKKSGFWAAALISALFFGLRHMFPFLYLLPQVLWIPALNWGILAFVYGLMSTYLYEKTGSLYPCVIGHFLVNAVGLLVM